MKRIFCGLVLTIICMIMLNIDVYAAFTTNHPYRTSKYQIEMPSSYTKVTEGSFTDENGDNINVQVNSFHGGFSGFTEEGLNQYVNSLNENLGDVKEKTKQLAKERYGEYISEDEIDKYVTDFKIDSIDKKEITTATKNNYKCYHVAITCSSGEKKMYMEYWEFASNNNIYLLAASASEKSKLQSEDVKYAINSFTIYNYKEQEKEPWISNELLSKIIVGAVFVLGGAILGAISRKKAQKAATTNYVPYEGEWDKIDEKAKNDKNGEISESGSEKDENATTNSENTIEEVENVKAEEKKYCTKCGKPIESDWAFCNYCGNKLK